MSAVFASAVDRAVAFSTLQIGLESFADGLGGGSSRFFSMLAAHLPSSNVAVHGIVAGKQPLAQAREDGITVACAYNAPILQRLRSARRAVREIVAAHHIDVAASHFALFTSVCLDTLKRVPLVVHFHGPWSAESRIEGASPLVAAGQYLVERSVYSRADRAIVLTEAFGRILHERYGVPQEKIHVVPGGVDTTRFNLTVSKADARARLGLPPDRPILLMVRRLAKRMGLENAVAAFADVSRMHREAMLVIVGGGRLADELSRDVRERGLSQSVVLTGRVPDDHLPLYYRAADLSIVPSVALEGFGLVVAESLACGTPAVVTPIGGLPEAVCRLSTNLILESSSSAAIANALSGALSGRLQLPSQHACAAYAAANFSWPIVTERVKSVYEEVL